MTDNLNIKSQKLIKYGNAQLEQQGITEKQTTIRGVLDKITEIESGAAEGYNIRTKSLSDGTQSIHIFDTNNPNNLITRVINDNGEFDALNDGAYGYDKVIVDIDKGTYDRPEEGKSMIILYATNNLGNLIVGASVTITTGTNTLTGTTDKSGRFAQQVDVGTYTVTVGDIEKHASPQSQSVVAEINETNYVYMVYSATTITINAKKEDGTAVVGANVNIDGILAGVTNESGTFSQVVSAGEHTVQMGGIEGEYYTPEPQTITTTLGQNSIVTMTYNRIKTALVIYAMDNGGGAIVGAEVTVTGDGNYSGVTDDTGLFYQEVPAGNYTISVNDQSGYTTPTSQSVSVVYGQELEVDMMYISQAKPIYGVTWVNDRTTSMTRTDNAVGMSYTISNGKVASDFDNAFPYNQMKREVIDGNTFVYVPSMWFRVVADADKKITSVAVSETKGDGDNWYQTRPFYYGAYGASSDGTVLKSVSGASRLNNITRATARTSAMAVGTGYHQRDLYAGTILMFLWWIEFATKNSAQIMKGTQYGKTTGNTDAIYNEEEGGDFCVSGYNTSTSQMVWHGIEDYIGNGDEWEDGITGDGVSGGKQYVSDDYTLYDDYSGGSKMSALSFNCPTSGACLEALGWDSTKPFLCQPIAGSGDTTYTTGFCDAINTRNRIAAKRGVDNSSYEANGVSAFIRVANTSSPYDSDCCRLMKEV